MEDHEANWWLRKAQALRSQANRAQALAEAKAIIAKLTKPGTMAAPPYVVQAVRDIVADLPPKSKAWR